jgi:hypothetical protein
MHWQTSLEAIRDSEYLTKHKGVQNDYTLSLLAAGGLLSPTTQYLQTEGLLHPSQ